MVGLLSTVPKGKKRSREVLSESVEDRSVEDALKKPKYEDFERLWEKYVNLEMRIAQLEENEIGEKFFLKKFCFVKNLIVSQRSLV